MSFNGDPTKPNSFEHYHPLKFYSASTVENGFNGINYYLHSRINDLIIKYVVGIRPYAPGKFIVDPFPFNMNFVFMGFKPNVLEGQGMVVHCEQNSFNVHIAGVSMATADVGHPVKIQISPE